MNLSEKRRLIWVSAAAVVIGAAMAVGAKALLWLIALITNVSFFHRFSGGEASPALHALGPWVILVPAVGGLAVGLLARFGSRAIQGHGIPEAMEQVLLNGSKIPAKILALKPLSTCVVIGTGGPFGAEGVVIATGGALGSVLGQRFALTPIERKTLLAAGAAAGLSAAFACPISAVLLAVELLLFEFHARSIIPVALASAAAAAVRVPLLGPGPMFNVPAMPAAGAASLLGYLALGGVAGIFAIIVVRLVYEAEVVFEKIPIHWMWKPALGGLIIGAIGLVEPRVFGPGYGDIRTLLSGGLTAAGAGRLGLLKLSAWVVGVSSATSSGTLAPLLLIGSSIGAILSEAFKGLLDPRVAALAGMAAFFGGMSGAFLASVILAFEATYQPAVLMPLLAAGASAYLVSKLFSNENIMTQKFVRQGLSVPSGLTANPLDFIHVCEVALPLKSLSEAERLKADGAVVAEDATLREAARLMIEQDIDSLAVLSHAELGTPIGLITQREVLACYHDEDLVVSVPRSAKLRFLARRQHGHDSAS